MADNERISSLKNCKKCNRVFSSIDGATLCSRCNDDVDDEFNRVREYIYDNPSSSIKDVSNRTGVNSEAILKWIREGRIVLSDHANISFCERCEVPIDGGRFCAKCIRELAEGLKSGIGEGEQQRNRVGMHIKDQERKK